MAKSREALQVAFNWMLPQARPRLKKGYDNVTAASLKVAISIAFPILSRYQELIESYPALFIYNSWRHICRIMREYDLSIGDHIQRSIIYGWVNGCCNIQNPMSVHEGRCFLLREKQSPVDVSGCGNFDRTVGRIRVKVVTSEKRDCYWVFPFYDGVLSGSFKFKGYCCSRNFSRNLNTMFDAGGLYCMENVRHFYSVNKLFEELSNLRDVYEVFMPPEVYLMNIPETTLVEDWEKGDISVVYVQDKVEIRPSLPDIIDDIFDYVGEIGIYGLTHLLASKFDKVTANVLAEYTKEFWKTDSHRKKALRFLIEKNCSKQLKFYVKKNWQGKRFCNDVCHLLKLSGYPRLWYYDKEMPATKCCQKYMLSCQFLDRSHTVLIKEGRKGYDYMKDKKKKTRAIISDKQDHINYAFLPKHNFDKCKLRNYTLTVSKTNVFNTRDKVYNSLFKKFGEEEKVEALSKKAPDVLKASIQTKEKIDLKVSYSEIVSKNLPEACEVIVKNERNKELIPLVSDSLKECLKFRRELSMSLGVKTDEIKNYVPIPWQKPKKTFRLKLDVGRQKLETTSDNVFNILDCYEKVCKEKLDELDLTFMNDDDVTIDDLVDTVKADSILTRRKLHQKKRVEKEWKVQTVKKGDTGMAYDKKGDPYQHFPHKSTKAWKKELNKRNDDILKSSKKGVVSNRIKIENHYRQFRGFKVYSIRKSRLVSEALKKIKMKSFHFIKFPKMVIGGVYDPISSCSKPAKHQLLLENPEQYGGESSGMVTYKHWAGEVTLDSSWGKKDNYGGLAYFDSNYVLRYYHKKDGEFFRFNRKGDFATLSKKSVQPKISILRKGMSAQEVDWRLKANEYGVHGRDAFEEYDGKPFWN